MKYSSKYQKIIFCILVILFANVTFAADRYKDGPGGSYVNTDDDWSGIFDPGAENAIRAGARCDTGSDRPRVHISATGDCQDLNGNSIDYTDYQYGGYKCKDRQLKVDVRLLPNATERCEITFEAVNARRVCSYIYTFPFYSCSWSSGDSNNWTEIWKIKQEIDWPAVPIQTVGDTLVLTAKGQTASPGNQATGETVKYTSLDNAICTVSGSTVTHVAAGTCQIKASIDESANFGPAETTRSWTVKAGKSNQTITVTTSAPATAVSGDSFTVAATADSGLPVTITISGQCTLSSGGTDNASIDMGASGSCDVAYNQAGDTLYNPAPEVIETVNIDKATQTITVTQSAPATGLGNEVFSVAATASSGLPVSITTTGDCTVVSGGADNATVQLTAAGSCNVHYDQSGNGSYLAASQVTESVTVSKANQSISITQSAPSTANAGTTFDVKAIASSGLPVLISASGDCSGSGSDGTATIQANAVGSCSVSYSQPGDAAFNAATTVSESVTVDKGHQTITVDSPAPSEAENGDSITVTASSDAGLPVQITVSGDCVISGGGTNTATIDLTAIGVCQVFYDQAGDTNFNAAPQVSSDTIVTKQSQVITVTTSAPDSESFGTTFSVEATASSGLPVSITTSTSTCSVVSGGTDTAEINLFESTGTCYVYYDQAGDATYKAANRVVEETIIASTTDGTDVGKYWTTKKLFTTGPSAGVTQPITSPPMVARNGDVKAAKPNLMIIFGTGKYLEGDDLKDKSLQSIYAVHDRGDTDLDRYTSVGGGKTMLERRIFTEDVITSGTESITNRVANGEDIDWTKQYGWYAELASDNNPEDGSIAGDELKGERSVFRPFVANKLFVFNTIIPVVGSCTGATQGWTMLIDWTTGKAPSFATYDANLDGVMDENDIGYVGYFNETAGSELGRGGDNIYDSSGDEARQRSVSFGIPGSGFRLGWEEKMPYGIIVK